MKILSISIKNFLSYESLDLDFTKITFAAVTGENGSGKSTVPLAVAWLLFGTVRVQSQASSVIRDEADSAEGSLIVSDEDGTYWNIQRSVSRRGGSVALHVSYDSGETWEVWGDHLQATAKAQIANIVQLTEDAFYSLMLVDQSSTAGGTRFTRANANVRRDILYSLVPELDRWAEYYETVSAEARENSAKIDSIESKVSFVTNALESAEGRITSDSETLAEFDEKKRLKAKKKIEKRIAEIRATVENTETKRNEIKSRERAAKSQLESKLAKIELKAKELKTERDQLSRILRSTETLEEELASLKDELESQSEETVKEFDVADAEKKIEVHEKSLARVEEKLSAAEDGRRELKFSLTSLKNEQKSLEKLDGVAQCPTCRSELSEDHCSNLVSEIVEKIEGLVKKIAKADKVIRNLSEAHDADSEAIEELEGEIRSHRKAIDAHERKLETIRSKIENVEYRLNSHEETLADLRFSKIKKYDTAIAKTEDSIAEEKSNFDSEVISAIRAELDSVDNSDELREELDDLEDELESVDRTLRKIERIKGSIESEEESVKRSEEELKELNSELDALNDRQKTLTWLAKALSQRGAPGMLLDSILGAIEQEQNRILSELSVGMNMQVEFRQTRPNKTNDRVKEVLDIIVHTNSGVERPIEAFSFGERVMLSLSNVFAMIKVFNGLNPGLVRTVFLDEPLGSLDQVRVPAFVDVIQTVMNSDIVDSMWIITHDEKVIEALPQRVLVSRNAEGDSEINLMV